MAFYEIETERLLLRQWRDGDWVGLRRTYGDAEVMNWIGTSAADLAVTAAAVGRMSMHWRLLGYGMFAVEERSSAEIVGRVGLMLHPDWPLEGPKVEVGWTMQRSVWGRGYATEAAKASLEFGFRRLDLPQIFSMTRPDNARSRAVMERCGLTLRGEIDFHGWKQVYYAIDEQDWQPSGVQVPSMKIRQVNER
ncbi:MAG: GNAT family N-acetyltransferase [Chloroflexota bacterium]